MADPVIDNIRRSLSRARRSDESSLPLSYPSRQPGPVLAEIDLFFQELNKLQGVGKRATRAEMGRSVQGLVNEHHISKAALWQTPLLQELNITGVLHALGVEIIPPGADKFTLASCELGVTEADFLLPETGTIGLLSSEAKPRAVSLLPPVHLVITSPAALRPDLHQVFSEGLRHPYMVFITGPSRTGDIEQVPTLGVHGPKHLVVWLLED